MPIKSGIFYLPHTIEQSMHGAYNLARDQRHQAPHRKTKGQKRSSSAFGAAESSSSGWLKSERLHTKKENQTAERREEESEKGIFARKEGSLAKGWRVGPPTQLATPIE
eukprot:COSAG05_NODE_47_length_24712_cov_26.673844_5_plen_109_part_00